MNRADLQRLSRLRLQEARALLKQRHSSGAYYLAGYAVECALKACIAKDTQKFDFPEKDRANDSYTLDLVKLLKVANLSAGFQQARQRNSKLETNWSVVREWSEQSRYAVQSLADAEAMIDAVGKRQDGVLPWIKLHW